MTASSIAAFLDARLVKRPERGQNLEIKAGLFYPVECEFTEEAHNMLSGEYPAECERLEEARDVLSIGCTESAPESILNLLRSRVQRRGGVYSYVREARLSLN